MAEQEKPSMGEKLDAAIEKTLDRLKAHVNPDENLKLSQAVLNLSHAKPLLKAK